MTRRGTGVSAAGTSPVSAYPPVNYRRIAAMRGWIGGVRC